MKKISALLLFVLAGMNYVQAQNVFPATGRTGIYTTAPATSLQVKGGARIGTLTNYTNIDSATGNLSFVGTAGYKVANNSFAFASASQPLGGLYFNASNVRYEFRNTSGTSVMNIGANAKGYVGIGMVTPSTHLQVNNGDAGPNTILTLSNTYGGFTNVSQLAMKNSESDDRALQFWNQNLSATDNSKAYDFLDKSANSIFRILNGGNVGIGSSSPQHKLDIDNGNIHVLRSNDSPDYTQSEAIFETGNYSQFIPSIALFSSQGGGCQLFGDVLGLYVYDQTGLNYLPVGASAFYTYSIIKQSKKNTENIESKDFDTYLQQIRNIKTVLYQDNNTDVQLNSKNSSSQSSHLGIIAGSLPKALQANLPTSPKVKPDYTEGYSLADIENLNLIGIKALDAKTQQIAQENAELKQENTALQQQINDILEKLNNLQVGASIQSNNKQNAVLSSTLVASLQQNAPNPFNNTTLINYTLPQHVSSAQIVITDVNGNTIKRSTVTNSGSLTVAAGTLASGTYKYSLIVDGKITDTKTMVLTK